MRIHRPTRRGTTLVESALVLSIVLLFILGVFEYSRLVFIIQVAENAARDGARYAVARTGDGTNLTDVQNYVRSRMANQQNALSSLTVAVENVNPDTGAVITSTAWNDAPFGGAIRVRVSGTYRPMVPRLLRLPVSFPLQATAMMGSEAN
ncbi:MAG: TadE/TadG family type IV pilus assembly protein [Gemmataceae bacterium]